MASFFDRKIKTLFTRFDINGNGTINIADFTLWGDRLIAHGKILIFDCKNTKMNINWVFPLFLRSFK